MLDKLKEIPLAVYKSPAVRTAFKALLVAAAGAVAAVVGLEPSVITGLLG